MGAKQFYNMSLSAGILLLLLLFLWSPFIPSRNLDEVFTYNHVALMSLRSRSHVKTSMVLT